MASQLVVKNKPQGRFSQTPATRTFPITKLFEIIDRQENHSKGGPKTPSSSRVSYHSTARQAMVNIMLGGANGQQRYGVGGVGAGNIAGQGYRGAPQQGQAGRWGQGLAHHDREGNASKCIFWSAIAIGSLLRGRSLEFVSPPYPAAGCGIKSLPP